MVFWALRDAVKLAGYYNNPEDTANYYRRLNREIVAGCSNGLLKCDIKLLPLPNMDAYLLDRIPNIFLEIIKRALLIDKPSVFNMPSMGNDAQIIRAESIVNVTNIAPQIEGLILIKHAKCLCRNDMQIIIRSSLKRCS